MEGANRRWNLSSGRDIERTCEMSLNHEEPPFSRGDRVVLMHKNDEEWGWVRWVGKLSNDSSNKWMVGVEFDNPIGNDNNIDNGKVLFSTAPKHAAVIPASVVVSVDEYLQAETHHSVRSLPRKEASPEPSLLGNDMSTLSAFHKMAYEQLRGPSKLPVRNAYPSDTVDKEWDLLPHMTYSSPNDLIPSNKETLNDKNRTTKPRSKSYSKGISSLMDEKPINTSSGATKIPRPTHTGGPDVVHNIDASGGGIIGGSDDSDNEYNEYTRPFSMHPFYHLSVQGIDQTEVITEDDNDTHDNVDQELVIGSLVEVVLKDPVKPRGSPRTLYGVIRWTGVLCVSSKETQVAGIEMEDSDDGISDGTLKGVRYFSCAPRKALFVALRMCSKDSRFIELVTTSHRPSLAFGSMDCQPVTGNIPPLSSPDGVQAMFGRNKGIQGHQNSCYLDATLFSMFAFTSVFDSLLFRPALPDDIIEYTDVQAVLREEIVNPLRKNMFVRADRIMKLRKMLDNLSSVRGLTTEEKDPEEFLQSLLAQILRAEPFLQLSSGQKAYHYQLFVEKDEKLHLPSVQTLFDQSFLTSDVKLKQIPSCLIVQMPRFGKDYKMYDRILPSMVLDVTDVIEDSPRQCFVCGKLAQFECRECFGQCGSGLESIAFCSKCMDKVHSHKKRGSHNTMRQLKVPPEFEMLADHCGTIPRVYMELFAVVCIETSHYVTFTRCGSGPDATWCFFDSMADRKGEQHGYNIPTVIECGDLMQWVGEESSQLLNHVTDNKALPDLPRRLLCDAYLCFYQSPQVMMYR